MAQSNKIQFKGMSPVNLHIDEGRDFFYNNKNDTVSIRSMVDAIVKVTGAVTGNHYIWACAGATVDVDVMDKDEILNKKRGRACCGGQSGKSLFELA